MIIEVYDIEAKRSTWAVQQLVEMAAVHFPLERRVPNKAGQAFDLKSWLREYTRRSGNGNAPTPTHFKVEAQDGFQAVIPWPQLDQACFLYEPTPSLHEKAQRLRLYVPDGSSNCLNVKNVTSLFFLFDQQLGEESSFGFKNRMSVEELKRTR